MIGDGERGPALCPPHPLAEALAALFLDRGADPNQGQAQVLLEHGAAPAPRAGRSYYERALLSGNVQMAELLARHGAARVELTGADAFRAACARLDEATARRLLAETPALRSEAEALLAGPVAKGDLVDVARLLLELGASPDAEIAGEGGRYRALHHAACTNAIRVAELLIARGADVDARDAAQRATPLGWALHVQMEAAVELLSRHTRDVLTLTAGGRTQRLRQVLQADPAAANRSAQAPLGLGRLGAEPDETPLFVLPADEDLALETAEILIAFGADPTVRNRAGQTPADKARSRGLGTVADRLARA